MAYDFPPAIEDLSQEQAIKLLLLVWTGGSAILPTTGPAFSGPTTTPHPVSIGAGASGTIPAGALSWAFVLLTGSGTIGGVSAPLNVPLSGGKLGTALAYTTAAASSAFILYETAA